MPALLVLAAGMGSRYGGLKQLDPVGPDGETLLDYSVHDARLAGFDRVVFLIRRDIEKEFREKIGARYEGKIAVDYAFQQIDDLPGGHHPLAGRTKPWGTGHAIWAARHALDVPFAAINADDFYGADAFHQIGRFLSSARDEVHPAGFAMVAYRLERTLSEHGAVSRGVCTVDERGMLAGVEELTDIVRRPDGTIVAGERILAPDTPVSINVWGFTPHVFPLLGADMVRFLEFNAGSEKAEFYIPSAVTRMITDGEATVRVLPTDAEWFGVTYREDRPRVVESIRRLAERGEYSQPL